MSLFSPSVSSLFARHSTQFLNLMPLGSLVKSPSLQAMSDVSIVDSVDVDVEFPRHKAAQLDPGTTNREDTVDAAASSTRPTFDIRPTMVK